MQPTLCIPEDLSRAYTNTQKASLRNGKHIHQILNQLVCAQGGANLELAIKGPVAVRPLSHIFYGDGTAFGGPVAIKVCIDPATGLASPCVARSYFDALNRAAAIAQQTDHFSCPIPHLLAEEFGLVVSEWVNGPTLSQQITAASLQQARAWMRAAGAWLSRLHAGGYVADMPINTQSLLKQFDAIPEFAVKLDSDTLLSRAVSCLRITAAGTGGDSVPWAVAHGDFKPDNLIVAERGLVGIDLYLMWEGPIVHDLAYFLNHLNLSLRSPRGWLLQPHTDLLHNELLSGYEQGANFSVPVPQLTWVRLQNAIRVLATLDGWSRPPKSWILAAATRRLIRDLCSKLV